MRILYEDFLKSKLDRPNPKGGTPWGALKSRIDLYDQSPSDWVTACEMKTLRTIRQLDKYEPAITYYLFAALAEATKGFKDEASLVSLFQQGFSRPVAHELAQQLGSYGSATLEFEALIAPSRDLRIAVEQSANSCPVAYVRRMASERPRVRFETATHLDCYVGDQYALGEDAERAVATFGFGAESKFTSDIDDETTYSPHRNQIARTVEVGNQRCERFIFLLIAPRAYRVARSRLYVYKMEEYKGPTGIEAFRRDTVLPQPDDVLSRWIQDMGWLDWEHIVEFLFPAGRPKPGWNSLNAADLEEFLKDRRLWPFLQYPAKAAAKSQYK